MDGLRNEEQRRQKSAILKHFGLTEKTDPKSVVKPMRRKLRVYGRQVNHTLLDFYTFSLSHFLTFTLSHFLTFTLSHFLTFTLFHFHTFLLSHPWALGGCWRGQTFASWWLSLASCPLTPG